jgi:hypothetical protein
MAQLYDTFSDNGQKPVVNVFRSKNGWIVTVYHYNRDKEISPETLEKRKEEQEQRNQKYLEEEETKIKKDLMTQLAGMTLVGKAAAKAQVKAYDEELEPWKPKDEKATPENLLKDLEPMVKKIAASAKPKPVSLSDYVTSAVFSNAVETYVFSKREEMVQFVTEMLQPIIE